MYIDENNDKNYDCDCHRAEFFDKFGRLGSFVIESVSALFDNPAVARVLRRDDDYEDYLRHVREIVLSLDKQGDSDPHHPYEKQENSKGRK